jgi:predicted dehydrogenase
MFKARPDVRVTWVCDPDEQRRLAAAEKLGVPGARAVADMRRLLDDASLDAVLVGTPDHWHAPAAILACQAGKHVYVEKPCSHNVREGRLLVEAARRHGRLVQHGTQSRSTTMMQQAVARLRAGIIGTVVAAKAWNIQRRGALNLTEPKPPPPGFDYDIWLGPASFGPYREDVVKGSWHWWFALGTGDMGNDGVHDIDYARWGLGVDTHPSLISAIGGTYVFDDAREFPDTQQVAFEYPPQGQVRQRRLLIYEQRLWSTNYPFNVDSGVEFYGTQGQMFLSRRGKVQVLNERNQKVELAIAGESQNDAAHVANFCEAIKGAARLNAEIEAGHLSASLCHLGNLATRLGRTLRFDPVRERIIGDDEADRLLSRVDARDHWGTPRET